jgi:hypothetical protein
MPIETIDNVQYLDMFSDVTQQTTPRQGAKFGAGGVDNQQDMFTPASTTETTTISASTTETTTEASTTETTTLAPEEGKDDTNILGATPPKQVGRPAKKDLQDLSEYFQDRMKAGKFIKINDVDDKGNEIEFVPKTAEDFDEVIDMQVNYRLDQRKKEMDKSWYQSKSPAWQFVAKYAELTDDPAEIVPFIQGIRAIDSVEGINAEEIAGAEKIVRIRMEQKGDSPEVIDEQIEALKTTDKLVSTAQKYKPVILQQEKNQLTEMVQQKRQEASEYNMMVEQIRDGAIKSIETPLFGKQKLKNEEKAVIYSMIGEPSEETQGYPIYTAIDNLFAAGDFETLKMVALLIGKKDSFMNYASIGGKEQAAAGIQRQLRLAADSRPAGKNNEEEEVNTVQRNRYTSKFGKG